MINIKDVIKNINEYKKEFNIPLEAELFSMEKRYIELPSDIEDYDDSYNIWDELVIVFDFIYEDTEWEISINVDGDVVRIMTSI